MTRTYCDACGAEKGLRQPTFQVELPAGTVDQSLSADHNRRMIAEPREDVCYPTSTTVQLCLYCYKRCMISVRDTVMEIQAEYPNA